MGVLSIHEIMRDFTSFLPTVGDAQTPVENRLIANTTIEDRTHGEAGAGENGVHPIITQNNDHIRPSNSQNEHREDETGGTEEEEEEQLKMGEETPPIKEEMGRDAAERERGAGEREGENGVEEVPRTTTTELVS